MRFQQVTSTILGVCLAAGPWATHAAPGAPGGEAQAVRLERTTTAGGCIASRLGDLTHELCPAARGGLTVHQAIGEDTVRIEIPEAVLTGGRDLVTIVVNGESRWFASEELFEVAVRGEVPAHQQQDWTDLAGAFQDFAGYAQGIAELAEVAELPAGEPPVGPQCAWPCFKCALGATTFLVGGPAVLGAGCNPVAVGVTASAGCVAAAITWIAMGMVVVDECMACCVCYGGCNLPGTPKPDSDCPDGTHAGPTTECDGGTPCCCDDDPPNDCAVPVDDGN